MKYRLKCVLFGHRFIAPVGYGEEVYNPAFDYMQKTKIYDYVEKCYGCGLTKEECGIKSI